MKRLFLIVVLLFVLSVSFVSAQQVVSSEEVLQVVSRMQSHNCKNLILSKSYGDLGELVVFIDNNKRYTLYWSGHKEKSKGFLSVWVRPEGTQDQAFLETCTDQGLDGSVDFGIKGRSGRPGSLQNRKLFRSGNNPLAETAGLRFREYWQNKFNEAIAAACRKIL